MHLNLSETITNELKDIDPTEDVFEQLLEILFKVKKQHKINDLDEEDFGKFVKKQFSKKDFTHLFTQMAHQRRSQLKPNAINEILQTDCEKELIRLTKSFSLKKFKPNSDHQSECEDLLDTLHSLPKEYKPNEWSESIEEQIETFRGLYLTHYKQKDYQK